MTALRRRRSARCRPGGPLSIAASLAATTSPALALDCLEGLDAGMRAHARGRLHEAQAHFEALVGVADCDQPTVLLNVARTAWARAQLPGAGGRACEAESWFSRAVASGVVDTELPAQHTRAWAACRAWEERQARVEPQRVELQPVPRSAPFPWHFVTLGTAAAAAGGGLYFGLQTRDIAGRADGATGSDYDRLQEEWEANRVAANIMWALAGVAALATVPLWWTYDDTALTPVTATGPGLAVIGRW